MVHIFFMVLFCGPSVCLINATAERWLSTIFSPTPGVSDNDHGNVSDDGDDGDDSDDSDDSMVTAATRHQPRRSRTNMFVPSWFNMGDDAEDILPIPLIGPPSRPNRLRSRVLNKMDFSLTGRWTGYYAYREFDPTADSEDEEEEEGGFEISLTRRQRPPRDLEHSVRGLRLDRRMNLDIFGWTSESTEGGLYDPRSSVEGEPLYLQNMTDLHAMQEVDRCFLVSRQTTSVNSGEGKTESEEDCDDLNLSQNWQHQRIISGLGCDAIGEFGIRGIISERTGLVRMVKNYLIFAPQPPQSSSSSSSGSSSSRASPFIVFGPEVGRMSYDLNGETIVWYYRGMMETRDGPGILGLWYDEDVSGPFWLYSIGSH
jgi:hypothetical protein